MQREVEIYGVKLAITDYGYLVLTPAKSSTGLHFSFRKEDAPELIAFIQQWRDHDPDQELREKISRIRSSHNFRAESNDEIIAAVRAHDAKYGAKG